MNHTKIKIAHKKIKTPSLYIIQHTINYIFTTTHITSIHIFTSPREKEKENVHKSNTETSGQNYKESPKKKK